MADVFDKELAKNEAGIYGTLESSDNSQKMNVCVSFGQQTPMAFCRRKLSLRCE